MKKKFIATPVNQYGEYVVERFNERTGCYERFSPEGQAYSKEVAERKVKELNFRCDENN